MVWSRQSRAGTGPVPRSGSRAERFAKAVAVAAALLAVPVAVAMGEMRYAAAMQDAAEKASATSETVAVLQEDAGSFGALFPEVPVLATWRGPDGSAHEGAVLAEPELTAGAEVPVWLDSDGELTAAPTTQGENLAASVTASLRDLLLMELAVLAGYWLLRRLIELARQASLGAEWGRIEPKWSRRSD